MILGAVRLCILFQLPARLLDKGVSLMASKPNTKERRHKQQSITRKIIIKMAILIVVLFGLSVIIAALLSSRSLKKVTNEKLVLTAYENAYTLSNNIESSYSQTLGFAGSLHKVSMAVCFLSRSWSTSWFQGRLLLVLRLTNRYRS